MKVVFHPGTQHSWQTALAFQEDQTLAAYITSIFYKERSLPARLLTLAPSKYRASLEKELRRRYHPSLNPDLVVTSGLYELMEVLCRRAGWGELAKRLDLTGNKHFVDHVRKVVQRAEGVETLWGYNNSSLETFQFFKGHQRLVLDQTIGHWGVYNTIISSEYDNHPEFFGDSPALIPAEIIERNQAELELSDLVVVGSEFCKATLVSSGVPAEKIHIIPYGFDETLFDIGAPTKPCAKEEPLQFVFVGSLIPRKGVHHLLKAFTQIDPRRATLTLIGPVGIPGHLLQDYQRDNIHFIKGVPRTEIAAHLADKDVFIFPSLFEGGGIVLYEALAAGLAIIQSRACGDGVNQRQGKESNGIVLNEVSQNSILEAVNQLIDDRDRVDTMKANSKARAKSRRWACYREAVRCLI